MLPVLYLLLRFRLFPSLVKTAYVFSSYRLHCPLLLLVQSKMEYQSRFLEAKPNFASTSPEMIQVLENNGTPFFATVPEEVAREIHATLLADCSSFLSGPPQGMTRRAQCVSGGR